MLSNAKVLIRQPIATCAQSMIPTASPPSFGGNLCLSVHEVLNLGSQAGVFLTQFEHHSIERLDGSQGDAVRVDEVALLRYGAGDLGECRAKSSGKHGHGDGAKNCTEATSFLSKGKKSTEHSETLL
jgi:hypothetical protein